MNNGWFPFLKSDNLNQNSAIRQFCPARMMQEQVGEEWGDIFLHHEEEMMEIWPPHFVHDAPQLSPSEVEEIVDTFFNVECYEKDNADKSSEEEEEDNETFDQFHEEGLQDFMVMDDLCFGSNVPMMIEGDEFEPFGSTEDLDLLIHNTDNDVDTTAGVDQGLQLVHLLLACAEAVGCRDTQLADSILGKIWPCVSPWGDSLHRVSHCFAMGLKSRLSLLQNVNPNGSFTNGIIDVSLITQEEKIEAFSLLHQTTPYIAFGFMAANESICQAAKGKEPLHIIDLGMKNCFQWPSLLSNLACRKEGPPERIRLTGVIGDQDPKDLESSIEGLKEQACSLGIHLEVHLIKETVSTSLLVRERLDLREGEALFVNSIMHLHNHVKESRGSLKTVLQSIKKLNPALVTVVEQDANHNGPFFLGRFLESLHYYSAIFDSLEASLPRNSPERMKIEKFHFAEEIRNVVSYEGCARTERHERADQWRRQLSRAGFSVVGMKCLSKAKLMISGYGCDGYTVSSEKGCLQLGWKGRPIMLASAWQVNNVSSSSSSS